MKRVLLDMSDKKNVMLHANFVEECDRYTRRIALRSFVLGLLIGSLIVLATRYFS